MKISDCNDRHHLCSKLLTVMMLFLMSMTTNYVMGQNVTGTVSDENGDPLIGVTVLIKNAPEDYGTVTDLHGNFSMKASKNQTLVFSYIGYITKEIVVEGPKVNVIMVPGNENLNEVVVVGYGTVKRKDVLGSISTVKADELSNRITGNVTEAMRGLTAGVKITSSGLPGTNASMVIRGLGSLTNNTPLFIIDGAYGGNEMGVNVEDIESIQVLKDASSAAIYGSRAANGVVIITTKKGTEGPLQVNFNTEVELNWLPRYDLMDAETYKKYDNRAYEEAILAGVSGVTHLQNHYEANTDWQDEMLKTAVLRNYNLSLSGGTRKIRYYASFNREIDAGALLNTGFDKYGARINTSGEKGIFSFGENFFYTNSNRKNITGYGNNPWRNFIVMPPTIPVYDERHPGGYGYGDSDRAYTYGLNPVAQQEINSSEGHEEYLKGNVYGQLSFFNDMLEARLNVAYQTYIGTTNSLRKKGNWTMGQGDDRASLGYQSAQHYDVLVEQTYTFKHKFGLHDLNAVAGITFDRFHEEYRSISRLDPLVIGEKYITSLNAATGTQSGGGSYAKSAMISYLGRINYSYADRYLFQLTARRDGTSKLPKKNRWGNFASVSLGWRISNEKFFHVPTINDLKLRANYGTLGNSSIGYWDYQATINTAPRAIMGSSDNLSIGMTQSRLTNTDLKWERKTTVNFGFDLLALDSRLSMSAEYYYSKSKDLLVYLPILMSAGNEGGNPAVNAGSLSNRGWEVTLGWRDHIGKLQYNTSLNISHVKNKVENLGYGQTVYSTYLAKSEIGRPLGMFYLYKMLGIFQNEKAVSEYINSEGKQIQPNALPGDIKYLDANDDGNIGSEDRVICGNPWPDLELGFNLGLTYKGFDFSVNSYGRFGQDVWNGEKAAAGDFSTNQNNFNGFKPWTQEHRVTNQPRIVYGDSRNSRSDQNRWLEKGSFFRISDITLGYSLPRVWLSRIGLKQMRFAVTLKNLITFTDYDGLDPEFADNGIFQMGVDDCSFPNPRGVQFSLSFTF